MADPSSEGWTMSRPSYRLSDDPERYAQVAALVAKQYSIAAIKRELGVDYATVKKYFPGAGKAVSGNGGLTLDQTDPEKFKRMAEMVADNASLNEIMRTLHCDRRTIKRAFPNAGWTRGASAHSQEVRETNRKLAEFLHSGKIQSNRDAGFNQRGSL